MDGDVQATRVPSHLKPFHPSHSTTDRRDTRESSLTRWKTGERLERFRLCPVRWRSKRKPRLKVTLKAILRKEWARLAYQETYPPASNGSQLRRPPMRMKDSDDYLTVRAANPRTGLISPSTGGETPCTPDSPGEALKLRNRNQQSPTLPATRALPIRANEVRKISGNDARHDAGINVGDTNVPVATQQDSTPQRLSSDQFVVHMPSAREPLVTYPGYTAAQIAALGHYQDKTRRISSDGYDRRLIAGSRKPSATSENGERSKCAEKQKPAHCPITGQVFTPYRGDGTSTSLEPPVLVVRKRQVRINSAKQYTSSASCGAERLQAKPAPPVTPTSTSSPTSNSHQAANQDSKILGAAPTIHPDPLPAEICAATGGCSRTAIRSAPSRVHASEPPATDTKDHHHFTRDSRWPRLPAAPPGDPDVHPTVLPTSRLSALPRVRLLRPEYAGVPGRYRSLGAREGARQCSMGCIVQSNGECTTRRDVSDRTASRRLLLETIPTAGDSSFSSVTEVTMTALRAAAAYVGSIPLPRHDLLHLLSSPDAAASEKVAALQSWLALAGHALLLCTALTMLLKLAVLLKLAIEVLLWPFAIPLRMLRWMIGV